MDKETLIANYFSDQLSAEGQSQLEALLEKDPAFREQFQFEKDVRAVVVSEERRQLKAKLKGFEEGLEVPKLHSFPWKYVSIAAAFVVLISTAWWAFLRQGDPDLKAVYDTYYEAYPNTVFPITRSAETESIKHRAFSAYELGDMEKAIPLFKMLQASEEDAAIDFYLAQAYLKIGEVTKAMDSFQQFSQTKGPYQDKAKWYLALAYLQKGDQEAASEILNTIVRQGGYKAQAAKEILETWE
ncbi:MAG: tetratricopeptide repeat protein [Bacteroidota bacterium]